MDMNWKSLAAMLPVQPCDELKRDVLMGIYDMHDLGGDLILYHRESVGLADEIGQIMDPQDWAHWEQSKKRRWGARCTCTRCGEDFIAGYVKNGIVLAEGPDGQTYDGYVEQGPDSTVYLDGDEAVCPHCWTAATVTRRSELRQGRTHQVLQAEVVHIERYTAVMYWMVRRWQDADGTDTTVFVPHAALIVDEEGKLRRFRAELHSGDVMETVWLPCAWSRDPMQMAYYSWEAENHRKMGGWTLAYGPDLAGHTGEKTALDAYIGADGCWPGAYLHVWERYPQVENLMRQGFAEAVVQTIDRQLDCAAYKTDLCDAPPIPWVDWTEVKPHRMLHMSKTEFREIRKKNWGSEDVGCWDRYRSQFPMADALEFEHCREHIGGKAVGHLLEMVAAGWEDLAPVQVVRYLKKQDALQDGVQLLIDYRKMLRDAELAENEETLWPRDLVAAHERITKFWECRTKTSYQLGFTSTFIKYRELEWTDGDLCVVLPRTEEDLAAEGKTLRHCVGTYGNQHCSGKPIFFIRHYRRPERSYYTLQIDMTKAIPVEIQLHGYGNERHGDRKQHRHKIPQKVRDFCDRWEREVLMPWFADQKAATTVKKSGKLRADVGAA